MRILVAPVLAAILAIPALVRASEPVQRAAWSREVKHLAGRMAAKELRVPKAGHVELFVELWNKGSTSVVVSAHDPFAFDIVVRDAAGKVVESDAQRIDVLSSPQAAVIHRDCRLALPVTLSQGEAGKWNLDITTKLWHLAPGKYRMRGVYQVQSGPEQKLKDGDPPRVAWQGTLSLPEIEIEISE
jgi:hypothetical protein